MLDFTYESFDDETKEYLNKAMDIYSTIKDKEINKIVSFLGDKKNYTFTKQDKIILSLFISGFYAPSLSKILEEYDDLRKTNLFDFINTKEEDIRNLGEKEYSAFYEKYMKSELISISRDCISYPKIKKVTSETIFLTLEGNGADIHSSKIMQYFADAYDLNVMWFDEHPIFDAINSYATSKGLLKELDFSNNFSNYYDYSDLFSPKNNYDNKNSDNIPKVKFIGATPLNDILNDMFKEVFDTGEKPPIDQEEKKIDLDSEELWSILDDIKAKFIGQERAVEDLFYNIVNNQDLAKETDTFDGERSIIFLDGPTGTGKTAITREITEKLDIPFTATSIVNYSSTGYVGGNITDTLSELYKKTGGNLEKAERGIIVLDEFDKIIYDRKNGGLEMKKAVQQQLLDFMGGGTYEIIVGDNPFNMRRVSFDTSKLTFVCLAALTDLRDKKTSNKQLIGFGNRTEAHDNESYTITPQDLIELGYERELVGRFNTYLHTDEYSNHGLLRILKESTISPIIGFERWITSRGKKLVVEDGVYEAIADAAYDLNTGARSLQTVMNNIRTPFLKEVLRGKEKTIYLDVDTVKNITEETVKRKVRK